MVRLFFILAILFASPLIAQHAYYWVPQTDQLASNAANWRRGSCNGPSGQLPGVNDSLIFTKCNGTSYNCTIDISLSVKHVELKSSYSATVSMQAGKNLTFNKGKFNGGAFVGNTGNMTADKSFKISGSQFTAPSGTLTVKKEFVFSSGSFSANGGLVVLQKGSGSTTKITGNASAVPLLVFHRLELSPSGSNGTTFEFNDLQVQIISELKFSGTKPLILQTASGVVLDVQGNLVSNNSQLQSGNVTLRCSGMAIQQVSGTASPTLARLEVNKAGGYVQLLTPLSISAELKFVQGFIACDSASAVSILHGAAISGASAQAFVRGAIRKVGNMAFSFPVGVGWKFRPLELSAPANPTDAFLVYYRHGTAPVGLAADASLTAVNPCDYWVVRPMTGNAAVTVKLSWDSISCDVDTLPTLRIGRWDATTGKWKSVGAVAVSGSTKLGTIASLNALNSWGYLALAKSSPAPVVDAGPDVSACTGTRLQLGGNPTVSGGKPPYTIEWSPPLYMDSVYFTNPIVTVHHDITYVVTVVDADDVRVTDSVRITALSRPRAVAGHDRLVTPNTATVLGGTVTGGTPPYSYQWQPATYLNQTAVANPTATPLSNITYSLTITDANGCKGNDQVVVRVSLPSLGEAVPFALLASDSLISTVPVQTSAGVGSRKFVSATITSTDTIVIKSMTDSLALAKVDAAIQYIKNLNATNIAASLDNQQLSAGVYQISGKATLNGTLTLNGDAHSVFFFNLKDSLVVGNGATIVLNGVNRSQVFFRVNKGMRISGTATLPAVFMVEKSIMGGSVHQATLWSLARIRLQGGSFAAAGSMARPSAISRTDAADWFGVNSSNIERVSGIYRSHWSDQVLRRTVPLLNLRLFRYPPGGDAKVWNGNDGWFFHADEKADASALSYDNLMSCVRTTFTFHKEAANLPADRWLEFKHILTGNDARGMYVVNMFTRPELQRDILKHAVDLQAPLQFVELGNEFYLRGQTCGFTHAADYANRVNQFMSLVRSTPGLEHLRFGVVGSAFNYETNLNNENGCRRFTWNAELLPLLSHLQTGDALTFHLYPTTGIAASQAPNVTVNDVPTLMRRAYEVTQTFASNELNVLAAYPHLEAWITEYNLTDPAFKIHGSWSHGLFLALMTLRFLEMEKVKRVTCQTMANDAARGLLFIDQYGYFIPDDWQTIDSTLLTQTWGLTAGGMAIKQLTDAMRYSTKATLLRFDNGPLLPGSSFPALYGWTFDKSLGDKQTVLLNLSAESQLVNIAQLAPYSAFEQIYCANPLYFFTGYVYRTSPAPGFYNAVEYNYSNGQITPVNYDSVHVRLPAGTTEIVLPPYSITRLYVLNSNGVWLRQSATAVCAADPNGTVPAQASTAVNFYASGGASYEWSVAETAARQQANVSCSPLSGVTNGTLKVYDPEGGLLGQINTLNVATNSLPNVSVTPTSFDNAAAKTASFTATASGASAYNWNPTYGLSSILGNSVTITPQQSRRYYVIGSGSNGCARVATLNTTVHPKTRIVCFGGDLRADLYPPILSICQGNTTTLVADGAADRYRWYHGNALLAEAPSLTITPTDNMLITLEGTDQTLPATARTSLWIRVYPTVSIEQDDLFGCANTFLRISGGIKEGGLNAEFAWDDQQPGNKLYEKKNLSKPIVESVFSKNYDPVFFYGPAGTTDVRLRARDPDYAYCPNTENDDVVRVHITDAPSLSASTSACLISGGTVTLSASGTAASYTWIGPDLHSSTGTSVTASPKQTASYTVVGGQQQCCVSKQITVNVETYQATCDGSSYCYGCPSKTVQVTPYDDVQNNYQWYENGVAVSGATGASYTLTLGTNESLRQASVYCAVSKKNGSCAPGRTNTVEVTLVKNCKYSREGTDSLPPQAGHLHLQPNPTAGGFRVIGRFTTCRDMPVLITIYDAYGKAVRRHEAVVANGTLHVQDDRPLPQGIYLVRACAPAECHTAPLVVTR